MLSHCRSLKIARVVCPAIVGVRILIPFLERAHRTGPERLFTAMGKRAGANLQKMASFRVTSSTIVEADCRALAAVPHRQNSACRRPAKIETGPRSALYAGLTIN